MANLTRDRDTHERDGRLFELDVAANQKHLAGAMVAVGNGGLSFRPGPFQGFVIVGRAEAAADNTDGLDGDIRVPVKRGIFRWANSGDIGRQHIGREVYAEDDQTVSADDANGFRIRAGIVRDVDDDGVWVDTGIQRGELVPLTLRIDDLSAVGGVARMVLPFGGTVERIYAVLDDELADGDATITPDLGGLPIGGGLITFPQIGSMAGTVAQVTPTDSAGFDAGKVFAATIGGANTAAVGATLTVLVRR